MRTYVYVDGFNLYFGALKGTPYKWLNIKALCESLLNPENKITGIKYFTAHVSGTANDPNKAIDQQLYIRALRRMTPEVEVILGQFRTHEVKEKLVNPPLIGPKVALVHERTEKGSDVNLNRPGNRGGWLV
jgi:hypothetical protein